MATTKTRKTNLVSPRTESVVREALEAAGCRSTAQRAAVFGYLEKVKTHPTAEEVYRAVRRRHAADQPGHGLQGARGAGRGAAGHQADQRRRLAPATTAAAKTTIICATSRPARSATWRVEFDPDLLAKIDPALVDKLAGSGFQVTGYRLEVLGRFAARAVLTQLRACITAASSAAHLLRPSSELVQRPRVGHVVLRQARAAGLQDAVAQHVQAVGAVGVGGDDDRNAVALGRGAGHVVQVEPAGLAFSSSSLPCSRAALNTASRSTSYGLRRLISRPVGWAMAETCGILQRVDDALGDLLARLVLAVVDAGHDPVGLGQHVVVQVEPALFQDVDLDSLEHREALAASR